MGGWTQGAGPPPHNPLTGAPSLVRNSSPPLVSALHIGPVEQCCLGSGSGPLLGKPGSGAAV